MAGLNEFEDKSIHVNSTIAFIVISTSVCSGNDRSNGLPEMSSRHIIHTLKGVFPRSSASNSIGDGSYWHYKSVLTAIFINIIIFLNITINSPTDALITNSHDWQIV